MHRIKPVSVRIRGIVPALLDFFPASLHGLPAQSLTAQLPNVASLLNTRSFVQFKPGKEVPPRSFYQRFIQEKLPQFKKDNPDMAVKDVFKQVVQLYRELPIEEKQKQQELLQSEKDAFVAANGPYVKNSEKRKVRRFAKKLDFPPTPPRSGYNLFISENIATNKGTSIKEGAARLTEVASKWKALPEEEKKVYNEKVAELRTKHHVALENWAKEHDVTPSDKDSVVMRRLYKKEHKK